MAPSYHRLGEVPRKRHVAFRAPDGGLYAEEVMGAEGFSGRYSILYHRYAPTRVSKVSEAEPLPASPQPAHDTTLRHHLLRTKPADGPTPAGTDELAGRHALLHNADVTLSLSTFGGDPGRFNRNGSADEIHYVFEGGGRFESVFGLL